MKVLHLVRDPGDSLAWEAIALHPATDEVRVVLLQDAVALVPEAGLTVAAAAPDARARGVKGPASLIEYDEIVAWMEWSDKVVAW